ncbi:pyridoxamine 5'-phosphate oxidase family protein [Nocardioides solisilvae]|uniref:pyridoxamine 5'-phosphate oxidase family protein n=1 Tax=Nocardioides solisilvae TaxID=1542435 RepID=UPI0013A543A3|nr:pyridoxamine 5'-phosphate oxidase family protein [Nocardioides solisilvae]
MDEVVELSVDECRELLRGDVVGRVAFTTPRGPRIVPVNYVVREGVLEVRTTSYSELATYAPGASVAFEVDHLDRERMRGWSVIVLGRCERVLDQSAAVFEQPGDGPRPWAGGHRSMLLRIHAEEVTGRRVGSEHWPHPVVPGPHEG